MNQHSRKWDAWGLSLPPFPSRPPRLPLPIDPSFPFLKLSHISIDVDQSALLQAVVRTRSKAPWWWFSMRSCKCQCHISPRLELQPKRLFLVSIRRWSEDPCKAPETEDFEHMKKSAPKTQTESYKAGLSSTPLKHTIPFFYWGAFSPDCP